MKWIECKERIPTYVDGWCLINGPLFVPIDYFKDEVVNKYDVRDKNMFRFTAIVNMNQPIKLEQFILHAWSGNWGSGYSKESAQRWKDFSQWIIDRSHQEFLKKIPDIDIKNIELWTPLFNEKKKELCICQKLERALEKLGRDD